MLKKLKVVVYYFVAATAPFTFTEHWIAVTDPLAAIKDEIEAHKGQFDILIVMSHVGVSMRNYAKKFLKLMSFSGVIHTITLKMVNLTMALPQYGRTGKDGPALEVSLSLTIMVNY